MTKKIIIFICGLMCAFVVAPVYSGEYHNYLGMEFVDIEAGAFFMGSCGSELKCKKTGGYDPNALSSEMPRRKVELSNGFQMGVREVSVGQFMRFVKADPRSAYSKNFWSYNKHGDEKPIVFVSWTDVQRFLHWLNTEKPDNDLGYYRLATEAEWEYVARAKSESVFFFGDNASKLQEYAWYDQNCLDKGNGHPQMIGMKKKNPWGVFDMFGNVWEWVSDWYDSEYYGKFENIDPKGPNSGFLHVVRGGAWNFSSEYCRAAARDGYPVDGHSMSLGFRVVREVH